MSNKEKDLEKFAQKQRDQTRKLIDIGIALSAEKNISVLLELIVDSAREFTNADGGTLYLVSEDESSLEFEIVQTDSLNIRMGGKTGEEINWPPVPLYKEDGSPNKENVSADVAISKKLVNIPDVYDVEGFNFEGTRKFDESTGYRSKSMLVIPMLNHENEIIGVLQLINARDIDSNETIPFPDDDIDLTASVASQAAIALTNVRLIQDLKDLFDSFIKTIATAIDEKSPYTAGHITRVANLTMEIAHVVNKTKWGKYGDLTFNEDELEELRLAAWMHDVGKITTPEHVVDKSTKLEKIFDRVELLQVRFDAIKYQTYSEWYEKKAELIESKGNDPEEIKKLDEEYSGKISQIETDAEFCIKANTPGEFMEDEAIEHLIEISKKTFNLGGETRHYLSEDELENLSIKRGTLNVSDRKIIENHAMMTLKMLNELPFSKKLKHVPAYAASHHEKLDGTGYPLKMKGEEISAQARIMAIADIFEALTAKDRPYKKPMMLSQAIKILGFMVKDDHIDGDFVEIFLKEGLAETYAKEHLLPTQIDWKTSDLEN
ncbi:GAF domain-containing protein [Candidatus Marinimicrobia bacterium MT.SAG.2]|nr:GAF domain-containing protein [Candidatus Marinimicrobia bacterium MT.SAG.2]